MIRTATPSVNCADLFSLRDERALVIGAGIGEATFVTGTLLFMDGGWTTVDGRYAPPLT